MGIIELVFDRNFCPVMLPIKIIIFLVFHVIIMAFININVIFDLYNDPMKPEIFFFAILFSCVCVTAQTVSIPDPNFEQALITRNIDSDGLINGQVLVSDVANVTTLIFDSSNFNETQIASLTGLEAFTNIETLEIVFSQITTLDVSHNIMLKNLNCRNNWLTSINVSLNPLLENLYIGNTWDLAPYNDIRQLDLRHNPNIKIIDVSNLAGGMNWINLKNGNNNPDMEIQLGFSMPSPANTNVVCIEVDNEDLALNNQYPYSEWYVVNGYNALYNYSGNCTLFTQNPLNKDLYIYPNPVSDVLYILNPNGTVINNVQLYDVSGRLVVEYKNVGDSGINVSMLAKGVYVIKIPDGTTITSRKIIVE